MKTAGLLLLVSGWLLVLAAIAMLNGGVARNAFVTAGLAVEVLGLILTGRAHLPVRSDRG
jgi:ABC-type transport system involved in cytochrome bd biosynthesis fused ATPase/permease subunit